MELAAHSEKQSESNKTVFLEITVRDNSTKRNGSCTSQNDL
jgi:hypothetical protein